MMAATVLTMASIVLAVPVMPPPIVDKSPRRGEADAEPAVAGVTILVVIRFLAIIMVVMAASAPRFGWAGGRHCDQSSGECARNSGVRQFT